MNGRWRFGFLRGRSKGGFHVIPWLRRSSLAGLMRGFMRAAAIVTILSVTLAILGTVAVAVYGEFGFHPEQQAQAWAALKPTYSDSSDCRSCHTIQSQLLGGARHASIACESCHGALSVHASAEAAVAASGPAATAAPTQGSLTAQQYARNTASTPSSQVCISCHSAAIGRPDSQQTVDPASHYQAGACLQCHDPHTSIALKPPQIPHPLEQLPACITCHNPGGLKVVPVGHVQAADDVCLVCHRPKVPLP